MTPWAVHLSLNSIDRSFTISLLSVPIYYSASINNSLCGQSLLYLTWPATSGSNSSTVAYKSMSTAPSPAMTCLQTRRYNNVPRKTRWRLLQCAARGFGFQGLLGQYVTPAKFWRNTVDFLVVLHLEVNISALKACKNCEILLIYGRNDLDGGAFNFTQVSSRETSFLRRLNCEFAHFNLFVNRECQFWVLGCDHKMPAKIKVQIVAARDLPVMDRSSDLADAFAEVRNL